jgi:hypothetical protein
VGTPFFVKESEAVTLLQIFYFGQSETGRKLGGRQSVSRKPANDRILFNPPVSKAYRQNTILDAGVQHAYRHLQPYIS